MGGGSFGDESRVYGTQHKQLQHLARRNLCLAAPQHAAMTIQAKQQQQQTFGCHRASHATDDVAKGARTSQHAQSVSGAACNTPVARRAMPTPRQIRRASFSRHQHHAQHIIDLQSYMLIDTITRAAHKCVLVHMHSQHSYYLAPPAELLLSVRLAALRCEARASASSVSCSLVLGL